MALTRRTEAPDGNSNPIENLADGEYEARLVYVADLGLQQDEYKGELKKPAQQIALGVEIIGETVEIGDETKPRIMWVRPFNIFQSLTAKGNELKYYSIFDGSAGEGDVPDWDAQLGKPCSVTVKNEESKGNVYSNIVAVAPIPAKYHDGVGAATTEPGVGDADDPDNRVNKALFGLPKYVFDNQYGKEAPAKTAENGSEDDSGDDDIPY